MAATISYVGQQTLITEMMFTAHGAAIGRR